MSQLVSVATSKRSGEPSLQSQSMDLFEDLPEPSCAVLELPTPLGSKRRRQAEDEEEEEEVQQLERKKVCNKVLPVLQGYVGSRQGERDEMQDAHVLLPDLTVLLPTPPNQLGAVSYFAVFDGHGGARASRYAAETLHLHLARNLPPRSSQNLDKLIRKCLLDSFRQTDEDFLKKASSQKPVWKDGCTVTCVLVVHNTAFIANLGDSRAVLCRVEGDGEQRKVVSLALSKEHNPTLYEERIRIQRAGGTVREGRVLGILEVSRSLGDGQFKRCGVISTPELRRCSLTSTDRFILLACDGLFKVFTAEEAVHYVFSLLQEDASGTNEEERYEAACQRLASEAVRRGCADNVTVILVSIGFSSHTHKDPHTQTPVSSS